MLGAFKNIQESLIGHEAANRMKYSPELAATFAEYQADYPSEWAQGQTMSFEQAVEFGLEDPEGRYVHYRKIRVETMFWVTGLHLNERPGLDLNLWW